MKIQCDVCNKEEASVFCTADEAALCNTCDHRVHHANKLASKHHRFSLSSNDFPLCDICQEKRGLVFCQQDRAILCRDCDVPIHTATEHTKKHSRFLLTGTKLISSATSSAYHPHAASSSSSTNILDTVPDFWSEAASSVHKTTAVVAASEPQKSTKASSSSSLPKMTGDDVAAVVGNSRDDIGGNSNNGSSISHYLMEMLPGWHFEEFLDNCSPISFGNFKNDDEGYYRSPLPLVGTTDDDIYDGMSPLSSSNLGIWWVPQAAPPPSSDATTTTSSLQMSAQMQVKGGLKEPIIMHTKHSSNKRRWSDDAFAVPQISPTSTAFNKFSNVTFREL